MCAFECIALIVLAKNSAVEVVVEYVVDPHPSLKLAVVEAAQEARHVSTVKTVLHTGALTRARRQVGTHCSPGRRVQSSHVLHPVSFV